MMSFAFRRRGFGLDRDSIFLRVCPKRYTQKIGVIKKKVESNSNYFGARLRHLIEEKGLGVDDFARTYGISQSQAFNWLKRDDAPLAKHWKPLAQFFGVSETFLVSGAPEKLESAKIVAEQAIFYDAVRTDPHGIRPGLLRKDRVQINPAHQPRPPEPTPQACIDYFLTYLKAAEHAPGGVGFAWRTLQKHFPLDEFEPQQKP